MANFAKKHSLRETAQKFHVVNPSGAPSKGLALQIIQGYEPRRACTRTRLGLPARIHLPRPVTINQLMQLPIQDMPGPVLRLALEFRKEMIP